MSRQGSAEPEHRKLPFLQGILPLDPKRIPVDIGAGVTLAALGIPEVMGYTKIAGMPVVTGLYTILLPIAVFALLGSSRHLVVGADSATAATMAAGLAGLAPIASPQYVALAGMLAIITGVLLVLARIVRLGFLADFLSRSVLIGFLTGVGVQVAMGQVGGMLGVSATGSGTISKFVNTLSKIPHTSVATLTVSLSVLAVIIAARRINRRIPGALIAVIGAIIVSWSADLASHGVSTLGKVPSGLPSVAFPHFTRADFQSLLPTAAAIFVIILAQSAATSRAYAAKYSEPFDENVDLVGLGAANFAAGVTGAFVVNGSPTKTQMVDGAGGKTQVASLTTAAIVLLVLLFLTAPLQYMPNAVLASVVFLIGIELIDIKGMRAVFRVRLDEFVIALATAVLVVVLGVEQAIIFAAVVSVIAHLRRGYRPNDSVLVRRPQGDLKSMPVDSGAEAVPGLVVYRFGAGLYYANSSLFASEILEIVESADPKVEWLAILCAAIDDIDYTGDRVIHELHVQMHDRGIHVKLVEVTDALRRQLDHYGISQFVGSDGYFDTVAEVITAFESRPAGAGTEKREADAGPSAGVS